MSDEGPRERSTEHSTYEILLMGYLDGELGPQDRQRVEAHLSECDRCNGELAQYRRLQDLAAKVRLREPQDFEVDRFWRELSSQMEWQGGWFLVVVGVVSLTVALIWAVVSTDALHWSLKLGIGATAAGFLLLFLNVLRMRLRTLKYDRYREVQR